MFRRRSLEIGVNAQVETTTTFEFGCEPCPNRRKLYMPGIAIGTLTTDRIPFRLLVENTLVLGVSDNKPQTKTQIVADVSLNQQCDGGRQNFCHHEEPIARIYEMLSSDPSLLDIQFGTSSDDFEQ
jgi:hypothetical protein